MFVVKAKNKDCKKRMIDISKYVNTCSDGCVICLETEEGCLTDVCDRPIVLSIGIVYGTLEEMTKQVEYALQRARNYDVSNGVCTVVECNHKSFRFPEKNMKEIFDIVRFRYKECIDSPIHFISLPMFYRIGFNFALHFVPSSLSKNIIVHKNLSTFLKHIPYKHRLKRWNGTLDFDVDEYAKWRCKQENTTISLFSEKISVKCVQESLLELQQSSNSKVMSAVADGIFYMEKYDFWGKNKKRKMLMVVKNCVLIFDDTKISTTNVYSRKINLNSANVQIEGSDLRIDTKLRCFRFYCASFSEYERFQTLFRGIVDHINV